MIALQNQPILPPPAKVDISLLLKPEDEEESTAPSSSQPQPFYGYPAYPEPVPITSSPPGVFISSQKYSPDKRRFRQQKSMPDSAPTGLFVPNRPDIANSERGHESDSELPTKHDPYEFVFGRKDRPLRRSPVTPPPFLLNSNLSPYGGRDKDLMIPPSVLKASTETHVDDSHVAGRIEQEGLFQERLPPLQSLPRNDQERLPSIRVMLDSYPAHPQGLNKRTYTQDYFSKNNFASSARNAQVRDGIPSSTNNPTPIPPSPYSHHSPAATKDIWTAIPPSPWETSKNYYDNSRGPYVTDLYEHRESVWSEIDKERVLWTNDPSTQSSTANVQLQIPRMQSQPLPHPASMTVSPPEKTTPTKSTLVKALPTVRDHTTDQLNDERDEYIPKEFDDAGEKKVDSMGYPQGGREYKCRTFRVPLRGQKLFMLATECARVLGYRDSYLLFNKNRSLHKIIASQIEKDDLIQQDILPYTYRSRQVAIVTARSMFRQFGSRVVVNGRRVRDDYWESKARKQGFTEEDLAGEKRPGGAKARDAAAAEAASAANLLPAFGPHADNLRAMDSLVTGDLTPNNPQTGGSSNYRTADPNLIDKRRADEETHDSGDFIEVRSLPRGRSEEWWEPIERFEASNSGKGHFATNKQPPAEKESARVDNDAEGDRPVLEKTMGQEQHWTTQKAEVTSNEDNTPYTRGEHNLQMGPLTDSGYASIGLQSHKEVQEQPAGGHAPSSNDVKVSHSTLESDEVKTMYSDASSFATFVKDNYISEFADALLTHVCSHHSDSQIMDRISTILPELLQAVALKIGHNAPTQMHRDVMVFIHKNRKGIATCFTRRCSPEENSSPDLQTTDSDNMTLQERMSLWDSKLEGPEDPVIQEQTAFLDDSEDDDDIGDPVMQTTPQFIAYRDFIFKSSAYEWLLAMLSRELILAPAEPNTMEDFRHAILNSLPSRHRVSRREPSDAYHMTFTVNWDPLVFVHEQGYGERPDEAVERAITLTGSAKDAQALTCVQYMSQTWPLTGENTFRLVKDTIRCGRYSRQACNLSDSTRLTAWMDDSKLIVQVLGTAASVAEIGQQLAWLGAALRSSQKDVGLSYCTPFINDIRVNNMPCQNSGGLLWNECCCDIDFTIEEDEEDLELSNGQCWHILFRNPTIVKGFPIPRRAEPNTGLEIPLNMMTRLTQAHRVTSFNQMLFIKGFSSMMVPTKCSPGLIVWHLFFNLDGNRISYLDSTVPHVDEVSTFDLQNARHILGWCVRARCYTGAAEANYITKPSKLPKCRETSTRQNICISRGKIVTGHPISIGAKDTRIEQSGYITKLKWLCQKFVVLWDEEHKRGWLANGASALLHLLRASLAYDGTNKFKSLFLFKPYELTESSQPHQADSAIDVLLNPTNRELKLYPEDKDFIRLEHRIHHLCDMLEQIIDYQYLQNIKLKQNSNHPGAMARRYLEGWNFDDLAKDRDLFYPRVAKLEAPGITWVSFIRDINAAVLFGRGFGDLIQPAASSSCPYWSKMPEQKYYLGTCVLDLKNVMDSHGGDEEANPIQLTDNIFWHSPCGVFDTCQCIETRDGQHSDLAQILLLKPFPGEILEKGTAPLEDSGAVIFGQNESLGLFQETEDLHESVLPLSSNSTDSDFHDSGVGRSFGTSSTSRLQSESPSPAEYQVGIVCALPKELLAVRALFDQKYEDLKPPPHDTNYYSFGRMGPHNVVAACLPYGEYGANSAAAVVIHLRRSFTAIEFCLLVGIGGGVPSAKNDIRLGDVVVSLPTDTDTGVIQMDLGKIHPNSTFERKGSLQRPPRALLSAISRLQSDPHASPTPLQGYINDVKDCNPSYKHPGPRFDRLFASDCQHNTKYETCEQCDGLVVPRKPRSPKGPHIHYGLIASGNQVMRDAPTRDQLGVKHNILCFEMEAAGVMNSIPCLVIRGICDYADSHKNKLWQEYAAATAAAYAKLLLSVTANNDVDSSADQGPSLKRAAQYDHVPRPSKRRQFLD